MGFDAEAAQIAASFRLRMAGLRRRLRPSEIPAAMLTLRGEKQAAMRSLKERRAVKRHGDKQLRQRSRAPPTPKPG